MSKEAEWLRTFKTEQSVREKEKIVEAEATPQEDEKKAIKEIRGFKDVAGMDNLKSLIREGFINVLQYPEHAAMYGVTVPNVLLYGPAGCGKTFFAEKVAEEVGINFMKVSPDDLGSIYVHGSQQKIGELFRKAEKKGPTLLFLDEFDCMVPQRSADSTHQHQTDEVDEFLTMLNNTAERGIYIMAATNHPENIDSSILRTGRIDEKIYVPMPDEATRESLFRLELNRRPIDDSVDYPKLAVLTKGYNCSDITYIVKTVAREKFNISIASTEATPALISQSDLESIITRTRPSVAERDLRNFDRIRQDFAPKSELQPRTIGFC